MGVRVRLNDGINLIARADLDEFTKAYLSALKNGEPLEIENGTGKIRRINPVQILYFEDATDAGDEGDRDEAGAPSEDGLQV